MKVLIQLTEYPALIACLLLCTTFGLWAQEIEENNQTRCLTTEASVQKRLQADPEYARFYRKFKSVLNQQTTPRNPSCAAGPVIVPVAVHFDAGIVPAGMESCAVNLVLDQLDALNAEINGNDPQNTAFQPLQTCFPGNPEIGVSCIEFCLATYDHPSGYNLTDGQYAVSFGQVNFNQISSGSYYVPFDPNWAGYLNIFITDLPGGLLGESAGIPGMFNGEGVVIDACAFGTGNFGCEGMNTSHSCGGIYNEGNTLAHEAGHYLGLYHIWGDNSFCTGYQDGIEDTPGMSGSYSGYSNCSHTSCSDLPSSCDSKDMYMNYMSYAADACMYLFTSGQADVMYQAVINAGFSQTHPVKCIVPETPEAAFGYSPYPVVLCPNLPVIHFNDLSTGPPESWSWTFSGCGVIPSSSGEQHPVVHVNTSGILTVTLTVSNFSGTSQTITEQIPVEILPYDDPACLNCNYELQLLDSYGDGWNGASLKIWLDDIPVGTYTIDEGYTALYEVSAVHGQEVVLEFSGGLWDEEVSFHWVDPFSNIVFSQGHNPPDGLLYEGFTNCSVCGYQFFDSGGINGQYKNSENRNITFCPPAYFDKLSISISSAEIEFQSNCAADELQIFSGNSSEHLLASICGDQGPFEISSEAINGCLHLIFNSDEYVTRNGWLSTIHCLHHCNIVSNTHNDGPNSLRNAIDCANNGDTIFLHPFIAFDTIIIQDSALRINKNLTISGDGESFTILSETPDNLFFIDADGQLRLQGLKLTGQSSISHPLIQNEGHLILHDTILEDSGDDGVTGIANQGLLEIEGNSRIQRNN